MTDLNEPPDGLPVPGFQATLLATHMRRFEAGHEIDHRGLSGGLAEHRQIRHDIAAGEENGLT